MTVWFVIIGGLFVVMALSGSVLRRLPLSTAMLYLAVGFAVGPALLGLFRPDLRDDAALLEHLTEPAVLVSLFSAGLKLRAPLSDRRWYLPVRLATVSMLITIGLVTLVGMLLLDLPLGAAVLLGAVLAPTDPVLAADVQLEHAHDRDRLRFSLTGEAGLNDGAAFPFVMLGLGLLGLHDLGTLGWRWLAIDVLWAIAGGLAVGSLLGTLVGRMVLYLRREHREAVGLDDFLALGLIALAYGVALLLHTYGFLAVFAAGLALRRIEWHESGDDPSEQIRQAAAAGAPSEVAVVLLVGGLLGRVALLPEALLFALLLLLAIRPISALLGLFRARVGHAQRNLIGWFGLRGIGSIYYLTFAIGHGLPADLIGRLSAATLTTVALSIVVHGISVTPLMRRYSDEQERRRARGAQRSAS